MRDPRPMMTPVNWATRKPRGARPGRRRCMTAVKALQGGLRSTADAREPTAQAQRPMHRPPFADRLDAAARLAPRLSHLRARRPLVLAIPRGAVPMGLDLARRLGADFDVVMVRKLGAPGNPEFAVGAVDEAGHAWIAPHAAAAGADAAYLARTIAAERRTMRERRARWSPGRAAADPVGRVVVVVDDGLATGATMRVALDAVRRRGPTWLVCAVPVAAAATLAAMREHCDEVACLHAPRELDAVGTWYRDFRPVDDDTVARCLAAARDAP